MGFWNQLLHLQEQEPDKSREEMQDEIDEKMERKMDAGRLDCGIRYGSRMRCKEQ